MIFVVFDQSFAAPIKVLLHRSKLCRTAFKFAPVSSILFRGYKFVSLEMCSRVVSQHIPGIQRIHTYPEKAAFSSCFNRFASNSCSRRFFVMAMARWISSRASESLPIFISRSPRTLGKRW